MHEARRKAICSEFMRNLQLEDDTHETAQKERSPSVPSSQQDVPSEIVPQPAEVEEKLSPEPREEEEEDVMKDSEAGETGEDSQPPSIEVTEADAAPTSVIEADDDERKHAEAEEEKQKRKEELSGLLSSLIQDPDECNTDTCVYSRKFLYCVMNLEKEFKLTSCPIEKPDLKMLGLDIESMPKEKVNKKVDFSPAWAQQTNRNQTKRPYGGSGSQGKGSSMDKRGSQMNRSNRYQARPSFERERPKLPTSENAWKPTRFKEDNTDEDTKKRQALLKAVRSLMNKITPNTKDDLIQEFIDLKVSKDSETLEQVINIIFDKAVEEPKFCSLYAELCNQQVKIELQQSVRSDKKSRGESAFRNAILTRSQNMFITKDQEEILRNTKLEKIAEEKDEKKKKELEEELVESDAKFRRRKFGNITFIGHLFHNNLLSGKIIQWCLVDLLKHTHPVIDKTTQKETYPEPPYDDEQLMCAIRLIETLGKKMDTSGQEMGKAYMDKVLEHLSKISGKCTNKIKFMIMNVLDLRKNQWVPRKSADTGPKKIEEVHRDVEMELIEKEREAQALRDAGRGSMRRDGGSNLRTGGSGSMRGNQLPPQRGSMDNRISSGTKTGSMDKRSAAAISSKMTNSSAAPRNIKLSETNNTTSLGNANSKSRWAHGAAGGGTNNESSSVVAASASRGSGTTSGSDKSEWTRVGGGKSDSRKQDERGALKTLPRSFTGAQTSVRRSSSQTSMASTDVEKSKSPPPHQLTSSQSSGARSQSPAATSYEPKDVDDVPESTSRQKESSEVPTTSSDVADEQKPVAISDDEDEDESRVNKTSDDEPEASSGKPDADTEDEPSRGETPADQGSNPEAEHDSRTDTPKDEDIDAEEDRQVDPHSREQAVRGQSAELSTSEG
ncbi:hypothetical protein WR25_20116 isoform B [Diploscapter pachys]|nr:hypothetical protein WR25_20116 isoform B [Diploscapter pachys]